MYFGFRGLSVGRLPTYLIHFNVVADPTIRLCRPNGVVFDPVHGVVHLSYQKWIATPQVRSPMHRPRPCRLTLFNSITTEPHAAQCASLDTRAAGRVPRPRPRPLREQEPGAVRSAAGQPSHCRYCRSAAAPLTLVRLSIWKDRWCHLFNSAGMSRSTCGTVWTPATATGPATIIRCPP